MTAEDVIESHPLRLLEEKANIPGKEMSLLIARSGVGKSAALINFALASLLQGKQVLHFSAGMPSEKTHQYYQEIFTDYLKAYPSAKGKSWEEINQNFMVVSYRDPQKMIEDLDSETHTVRSSSKIKPDLVLVDGLDYDDLTSDNLNKVKEIAIKHEVKVLASINIHRDPDGNIDLEAPLKVFRAFTEHVYFMEAAKDHIHFEVLSEMGQKNLPVHFCPHDLIFKLSEEE
jgi:hypothetical protein